MSKYDKLRVLSHTKVNGEELGFPKVWVSKTVIGAQVLKQPIMSKPCLGPMGKLW
jgi:hypothetical protein